MVVSGSVRRGRGSKEKGYRARLIDCFDIVRWAPRSWASLQRLRVLDRKGEAQLVRMAPDGNVSP